MEKQKETSFGTRILLMHADWKPEKGFLPSGQKSVHWMVPDQ